MKVSSQFATSLDSPQHIAISENLGYDRAWLHDTPQQSPDVWMMLALAAERTDRIGLGPGVLVPALRHPMVNAAATAALYALAPGRVAVAFGTGFSAARAMGAKASTWSYARDYIRVFRDLLRGETVEWNRGHMRMMHPAGFAPPRPIAVPIAISAVGPKGLAVAKELGDGLFTVNGERGPAELVGEGRARRSWHCSHGRRGTGLAADPCRSRPGQRLGLPCRLRIRRRRHRAAGRSGVAGHRQPNTF